MSSVSWERVRELVRKVYEDCLGNLDVESLLEEENLFVRALLGRDGNVFSRLERSLVTLLGGYAPEFFKPFFAYVEPVGEPFDFRGILRGRSLVVKVVTGARAFNSTMRRFIEESSYSIHGGDPAILTLQGEYFEPQPVGRAVWYSAPSSWKLVTGENGAYRRFRDIVFEEAWKQRDRVREVIRAAVVQRKASGKP